MLSLLAKRMPEYVMASDKIMNSGICYTLVRAAHLVNGTNEEYYLSKEGEKIHSNSVCRSAIAKFVEDMIKDDRGLGENESLGITN